MTRVRICFFSLYCTIILVFLFSLLSMFSCLIYISHSLFVIFKMSRLIFSFSHSHCLILSFPLSHSLVIYYINIQHRLHSPSIYFRVQSPLSSSKLITKNPHRLVLLWQLILHDWDAQRGTMIALVMWL